MKRIKAIKSGQMEIMGLAIIVILVLIGMLFAIRFVVLKEPEQYKKEFTQTQLASNMLSTLLKTTVSDCNDLSFEELYQDCARTPANNQICEKSGNQVETCTYISDKTKEILGSTLEKWNIGYGFNAQLSDATDPLISDMPWGSGCPGIKKHKEFHIPIDTAGRTLTVSLDIC